jgi:hypothetical protein
MDDIDLDDLFGEGENTLFDGMEDGFDLNEIGDEIMGSIDAGSRFGSEADGDNNDDAKQPEENDVEEEDPSATTTTRSSSKKKSKSSKASKSKTKKDKNAGGSGTTKKKRGNISADGEIVATQEVFAPEGDISPVAPESISKGEIKKKKKKKNKPKVGAAEVGVASPSSVSVVSKASAVSVGEQSKMKAPPKVKAPPSSSSSGVGANLTKTKTKKSNKLSKRHSSSSATDAGHDFDWSSTKRQAQDAIEDAHLSQQQLKAAGSSSNKKHQDPLSPTAAQKSNLHQLFDRQLKQQQLKTAPVQQASASQQRPRPPQSLMRRQSSNKSKLGQLTTDHSPPTGHVDDSGSNTTAISNLNGGPLEPSNSLFYPFCILPNDIHYGARKYAKTIPLIEQMYGVLIHGGHKRDDHLHQHEATASSASSAEQHNIAEVKTTLNNLDLKEVAKELKEAHDILMRQRSFLAQSNDNMQQWCKIHFKQYDYSDIYRNADDGKVNSVHSSRLAPPQSQESSHEQHESKSPLAEYTKSTTPKSVSSSALYGSSHIPSKAGRSQWLRQNNFARSSSSLRNLCAEQPRTIRVKVKCTAFTQKKQKRLLSATIDLSSGGAEWKSEADTTSSTARAMPAKSASDHDIIFFESPRPITSNASRASALPAATDKLDRPPQAQEIETAEENDACRKEELRLRRRRSREEEEQRDWIGDYAKKLHHLEEQIKNENECGDNSSDSGTLWTIMQEYYLAIDTFGGDFTFEDDEFSGDDNADPVDKKERAILRARGRKRELIRHNLRGVCEPELPSHPLWEKKNTGVMLFQNKKRRRVESHDATKQQHGAAANKIVRKNGKVDHSIDKSEDTVTSENVTNSKIGVRRTTKKCSNRFPDKVESLSSQGITNGRDTKTNTDSYIPSLFDGLSSLLVDEDGFSDADEDEASSNINHDGTLDDQGDDDNDDSSIGSESDAAENTPRLNVSQLTLDERTYIQLRSTNMIHSHSGAQVQNDDEAGGHDHDHCNDNSKNLLYVHEVDYEASSCDDSILNPVSLAYQIELLTREHNNLQRSIGQCAGFLQSEAWSHMDQLQAEANAKQVQRRMVHARRVSRVNNHHLAAKEEREGGKLATMNHRSGLDRVPKSLL